MTRIAFAAVSALMLTACADGSQMQSVAFESTPPGAVCTLGDGETVTTPATVRLMAWGDITVTCRKDGYRETVARLEAKMPPQTPDMYFGPYGHGTVPLHVRASDYVAGTFPDRLTVAMQK
ncbi:MAG: hypothetical protein H7840_08970 [Alphaproteobacteria bacterium]